MTDRLSMTAHAGQTDWWNPNGTPAITDQEELRRAISRIHEPLYILKKEEGFAIGMGGVGIFGREKASDEAWPIAGYVPPCLPENLGDSSFVHEYRLRYPYVAGAMANGISSVALVEAMAGAGMLGFFGAAGLPLCDIERAIDRLQSTLGDATYGLNLIHSPQEPLREKSVVDLYLQKRVRLVEASAYMDLTLPLVRYRVTGIHQDQAGRVVTPNRILAKVSRVEVATKFFSPPPDRLLAELVRLGEISDTQARLAAAIPMAADVTAEADSGGHTDNRPAVALMPTMIALRDRMLERFHYDRPLRVGAAGGISTPASAAAAFAMGAAYILTGSVNQACVESGTSHAVREMLAQAQQADITMAPAADMFEMGVRVQVLKRGTMFAMRAQKLYDLYRHCASIEDIPEKDRNMLEKDYFRTSMAEIWKQTRDYFQSRDPSQVSRAEQDPKHRMSLIFRWYLGRSSQWANHGEPTRRMDYQIWCGQAMGAFNEWVRGSFLEHVENRDVVTVALNILYGVAVTTRVNVLKCQSVPLSRHMAQLRPQPCEVLREILGYTAPLMETA